MNGLEFIWVWVQKSQANLIFYFRNQWNYSDFRKNMCSVGSATLSSKSEVILTNNAWTVWRWCCCIINVRVKQLNCESFHWNVQFTFLFMSKFVTPFPQICCLFLKFNVSDILLCKIFNWGFSDLSSYLPPLQFCCCFWHLQMWENLESNLPNFTSIHYEKKFTKSLCFGFN